MSRAAAFFDVDGTLVAGNIVQYYANLATLRMPAPWRWLWTAGFALRVPYYIVLDRLSRSRFQRALYRNYRRFRPADLEARAREHFAKHLEPRIFPAARERVRQHLERGEPVVLVTGSLRPIVAPLAMALQATDCVAAELHVDAGNFSGELDDGPLAGERKAAAVSDWAARHGIDVATSHGYADSLDDLPMLRRVGHAHVVNPRGKLARLAAREGWETLHWERRRDAGR
jgi:HAD superfamily hydrolase (TIGR01490 family)